jgi:Tfp pilus assembly protein PilV
MITESAGRFEDSGRPARTRRLRRVLGCVPLDQAGISLLEILISIVVLAVVVLGATAFSYQGRWALDEEEHKRTATEYVSSIFEDFRNQPAPAVTASQPNQSAVIDNVTYTVHFDVTPGYQNPNQIRVYATVSWPMRSGGTRSFRMSTLLSNHD